MQFDDVYKLVYQHCYRPKHMSMSKIDAFNHIKEEALKCENFISEIVDIGNGYVRVSIVNDADSINKLSDAFYKTINNCSRSIDIEETLSKIEKYVCELFEIGTQEYDEKVRYLKERTTHLCHIAKFTRIITRHIIG